MNKFFAFIGDNFLAVVVLLSLISILIIYERKKGGVKLDASEITRLINKNSPFVYDLRSSTEYSAGSIAGAINIQTSNLIKGDSLFKANDQDCIILICKTGTTSSKAAGDLKKQGFTNVNVLSGGMMNWTQSGMPLVKNK
jgi:rhodanese-related sulfurtransferase|tara:strand:+ start:969 stop:1388 length:420 start_codon:yes stop_codon:yes gene_type:complete